MYTCLQWTMSELMLGTYQHQQWLHMTSPKWGESWHQERRFVCGWFQRNQHQICPSCWSAPHVVAHAVSLYSLLSAIQPLYVTVIIWDFVGLNSFKFVLLYTSPIKTVLKHSSENQFKNMGFPSSQYNNLYCILNNYIKMMTYFGLLMSSSGTNHP